ncbi:MAG: hypothetical protein K1X89_01790 [Myxococcaceae bacterium]|nr:hypothetical protein [Myxococcaceae bacterium]
MDKSSGPAQVFGARESLKSSSPSVTWELASAAPELSEAVHRLNPALGEVCAALRSAVPHPKTRAAMEDGPFIRPLGHGRCFYVNLESLPVTSRAPGFVAIKGTEAVADDYADWMRQLRSRSRYWTLRVGIGASLSFPMDSEVNELDRWPVLERKIPGCIGLSEAMGEARVALDFQRAFFKRYGEFARAPLPLMVLQWPQEVVDRVARDLRPLLSKRAIDVVERALEPGLGVYVYHYPSLPIRLLDWSVEAHEGTGLLVDKLDYSGRLKRLEKGGLSVKATVEKWTELFVKMLAAGFLPKESGSLLTADLLQPWNVALDGGFLDLDSLVPSEQLDDKQFSDTLRRSLRGLMFDIAYLMMGKVVMAIEFRDRYPELMWIVLNDVKRRLDEEDRVRPIEKRLKEALSTAALFQDLDRLFRQIA